MSGRVVVGQIVGAHALRGQVRVRYFGDGPDNLLSQQGVWLAADAEQAHPPFYPVTAGGLGRAGEVRLELEGIEDREAAVALRGLLVLADASQLEPLARGEYYWHELVGCSVETTQGEPVGRVREIWETGAHDVLVVVGEAGRELLVPTAREFMREVDLEARRIVVEAPPGLLDEPA